jgi:hypothetical protein
LFCDWTIGVLGGVLVICVAGVTRVCVKNPKPDDSYVGAAYHVDYIDIKLLSTLPRRIELFITHSKKVVGREKPNATWRPPQ